MESIAAMAFDKIKMNPDLAQGKYTEYVRFLGKDFWMYIFGQSVWNVIIVLALGV